MLYDLYKREVEQRAERRAERRTTRRTWDEVERLTKEWEKLSPEEQKQQGVTEYVRSKRSKSGEYKVRPLYHPTRLRGRLNGP